MSQTTAHFRDLNKNGRLDPYEDPTRPIKERIEDLLAQMTLEEKAGMMFNGMIPFGEGGTLAEGLTGMGPFSTAAKVMPRWRRYVNRKRTYLTIQTLRCSDLALG